ncbi:MAG: hypothetical protein L3J14_04955 [Flavobacteriaceae bacterium]|nr:hypothetical protein [Flavobacteriaceae bacterium]
MQSLIKFIFLITFSLSFAQNNEQKTDSIGTDILNASYVVFNNVLIKKNNSETLSYENISLGEVSSVDIINSQEIVLFYDDFNTVIVLDNQLNLIQTVLFQNTISFAKKGIANTLWIFNTDENKLELYDYKSQKITLSSQVITDFEPQQMESSFNFVKLIGKEKTLIFNQYLNLTDTIIHQKND